VYIIVKEELIQKITIKSPQCNDGSSGLLKCIK